MADNKLLGAGGLYFGGNEISKAYMGNNLVWEKEIDYSKEYFCVEALENCSVYFSPDTDSYKQIVYCITDSLATSMDVYNTILMGKDIYAWSSFDGNNKTTTTPFVTINSGEKLYIIGNNEIIGGSTSKTNLIFKFSGRVNLSGNIMSITHGATQLFDLYLPTDLINKQFDSSKWYALARAFKNNKTIIDASNLILSSTTLGLSCYKEMFLGCSSLTTAPELPATTLSYSCYYAMFSGCSSLTTAPELPATKLSDSCYYTMFFGCSSLTTAPELPATKLIYDCYRFMFYNCSKLNYIKAMFTTTPSTSYTTNWVNGVSSTGTFVKNSAATWNVTGANGIPSGWTVQTASS